MLIAQRPTLAEDQVDEYRSRFTIEPLEPGFGYTIGNSLRRTLLSSIPGAAAHSTAAPRAPARPGGGGGRAGWVRAAAGEKKSLPRRHLEPQGTRRLLRA